MVARLILFLFGYGLLIGAPIGLATRAVYRKLQPRLERRRRRLKMRENARLLAEAEVDRCFVCGEPCSDSDCYETGKGSYHAACLKALLGEGD